MWLHFLVRYPHGKKRSFRFFSADLENLMEVLNYLAASGCQVLSAFLIDTEGHRTELPVDVFDGEEISGCMRRLQREYYELYQALGLKKYS